MCLRQRLSYPRISRILFTPFLNPHTEVPADYNMIFLGEQKQKLLCFPPESTAEIKRADTSGRLKKANLL